MEEVHPQGSGVPWKDMSCLESLAVSVFRPMKEELCSNAYESSLISKSLCARVHTPVCTNGQGKCTAAGGVYKHISRMKHMESQPPLQYTS